MIEALKLVRILILKNPKEVAHLLSSSKIVSIITDYVLMDVEGNMYALLVQIEALGIWMALLKYWLYVEKFTYVFFDLQTFNSIIKRDFFKKK